MSSKEKLLKRFYKKPVPNDITFEEICTLASHFGCNILQGANHTKVAHQPTGTIIPIPRHGKCVEEAYIKQLKILFDRISNDSD